MSGQSTLRLCFAAMAPALTEAASARLKLQDSGTKHCDTRNSQADCDAAKVDRLSSPRKNGDHEPFPYCDSDDRVDLTSFTNGTLGDTVRSLPKGKGGGLALTSGGPKHVHNKNNTVNIGRLTAFAVNSKHFSSLIGEEVKTATILDGLKRMNQPHFAATDQLEINKNHFNSSDKLRILASKVSKSGMVNGDRGHNSNKEEEQPVKSKCRESGDAPVNNEAGDKKINSGRKSESVICNTSKTVQTRPSSTMGMCDNNRVMLTQLGEKPESSQLAKSSEMDKPCEDVRKDCVKKQAYLERKVEMLLRRLKRMKGKVVEGHTKEQLVQYVNLQHRNLQMVAKSIKSEAPCPEVLKEHFLSNEDVKNMSTSQLVKLVRDHQSNKSLAVADNSPTRFRMVNSSAIVMSPALQAQSLSTCEKLSTRVQATGNDLDSDATASSSGGESGDEDSFASAASHDSALPSLLKRAEWKWAVDRAAIVSRWTWLQAQVSDLEYKIRQQSQVHRQLRNSKGGVVLGDPPTAMDILRKLQGFKPNEDGSTGDGKTSSSQDASATEVSPYNVSALLSNVDKQATRLTQSLSCLSPATSTIGSPAVSKLSSPIVNGLADSPSSSVTSEMTEPTAENSPLITSSCPGLSQQQSIAESHILSTAVPDASCQAARCRPLRSYRKRKILRTIDLYKTSVKAARLSDVRCRCSAPFNPCAMCGGRFNNTLPMDAENMSFNERVALLDSSFHPVLSFPQDIPLSIHCEGVLKSGLWQNKPPAKRSRAGDYRRQKVLSLVSDPGRKSQGNKISNARAATSTPSMITFTTKIKNKYEGKTKAKNAIARTAPLNQKANKVKRKAAKIAKALKKKEEEEDLEALYFENDISGPPSSRDSLSNSASQSGLRDLREPHSGPRRRRVDNAFDINNIEIPHSIAASTRVEQIQYKEIVTPKWREVDDFPSQTKSVDDVKSASVTQSVGKQLEKTNGVSVSLEQHGKMVEDKKEDEEIEDLSDEKYLQRHSLPESEEMKRFRNFLQYPPVRRSRARSDAFLSVSDKDTCAKTEPVSNQQQQLILDASGISGLEDGQQGDQSSLLNKSLPALMQMQPIVEDSADPLMTGRRRTIPSSRRERSSSGVHELCSVSSLEVKYIEPWPKRTFPLSEDEFRRMQSESSSSFSNCEPLHQRVNRQLAEPSGKVYVGCTENQEDGTVSRQDSRATSPFPSNESLSSMGDDSTDPDWLSNVEESKHKPRNSGNEGDDGDPDWTGSDNPKKARKR